MRVSSNVWNEQSYIFAIATIRIDRHLQRGESGKHERNKCECTIYRKSGDVELGEGGECDLCVEVQKRAGYLQKQLEWRNEGRAFQVETFHSESKHPTNLQVRVSFPVDFVIS
jgi:hypothetical protein